VDKPIDAYLGVDVGSISTNVVVINEQKQVLAKVYLMTAGKPLEAVRQGLDIVGKKVAGKVKIKGAATTGSGRYLTGDFIGADLVINEITAQAAGAAIVNPMVDTIFEIGGQDSKYISLENGVVVDFEMNHACAAGTGSFLEEQAQRLGININQEFAQLAFKSNSPIKLGERCTVFIESDLLSYQQQGAQTEELVAGLSYSIVTNYLNRVVGRRKIGDNICFQGGTAFNKAVWAAFENVTGKKIMVPDHHEVTGAIGAAFIVAERIRIVSQENAAATPSGFKGFDNLAAVKYSVESFTCEHCSNNCEIKKVEISDSKPLFYGSRCDRYNLRKNKSSTNNLDAFEYRQGKLLEFSELNPVQTVVDGTKGKIGIPAALINYQLLPLFSIFFKSLGFEVVLSRQTDKKIIRKGLELVTAQPCFPVKVAYGHIAELIERQVDYIFIPSIVSMTSDFPENKHNQLCPYVQSLAYQVKTAFVDKLGKTEILTVPIRLGEGKKLIRQSFLKLGEKIGAAKPLISQAIEKAFNAQNKFEHALIEKGKEILGNIKPDERLFVLISRPYNGCDEGLNLQLPKKLNELNAKVIPMDMLNLSHAQLTDKSLHTDVYWSYGQKILRAAEIIKDAPELFAIYLSNFSCGPDSFLLTFFKDIMLPKPCLQLELDEHSADAGVITRLEAFLDSLKHYHGDRTQKTLALKQRTCNPISNRKLYIPYMGDNAYGVAACLRAYGQQAEVIPMADETALLQGRRFTTGKECLPCAITAGDMLKVINAEGFNPEKVAFFMPSASGPCRFGMYNCLHKLILKYVKVDNIPIVSPNQDSNFYTEFVKDLDVSSVSKFMVDMWTAAVGIDLLHKLLLKLRPFSKDISQAQRIYDQSLEKWIKAVEERAGFSDKLELMRSICTEFEGIELDYITKKPRIGIVGEIYVRSHPFANSKIIERLEKLGAACDLASLAEWVYYTNFTRKNMARRKGQIKNLLTNLAMNHCQRIIERKLAKPLEKKFGKLTEDKTENVISLAEGYLHPSFEGEAILSIGKTIELYHQGIGGVVNVMPFSCMPSTIVSSHTMRLSKDCNYMPILNLSFDGQEDSTLTTRLEAFVEQVRQKQDRMLTVSDFLNDKACVGHSNRREHEKLVTELIG
jgi:predicted CoA-substrate-specific enzyme activase